MLNRLLGLLLFFSLVVVVVWINYHCLLTWYKITLLFADFISQVCSYLNSDFTKSPHLSYKFYCDLYKSFDIIYFLFSNNRCNIRCSSLIGEVYKFKVFSYWSPYHHTKRVLSGHCLAQEIIHFSCHQSIFLVLNHSSLLNFYQLYL